MEKSGGGLDVIIDDGSHKSLDVIGNFINYFPLLSPGGIYIVEDMHCAYWSAFDGGYFNQRSAAAFFKCIFDLVNLEHFATEVKPQSIFNTFFRPENLPAFLTDGSIFSLTAYNSIYVLEKSSERSRPILGNSIVAGVVADVDDRVLKMK